MSARGGRGIAVAVDHTDDGAVAALFERVGDEQDGPDLLVVNAVAGNDLPFESGPFWTLPLGHWRNMFVDGGVCGHLVTAWHAAPLLIERRGLLVLTGYETADEGVSGGHRFYDLAMNATSRLAHDMAHDLRPRGVSALAISRLHPHRGGHRRARALAAGQRLGRVPRPVGLWPRLFAIPRAAEQPKGVWWGARPPRPTPSIARALIPWRSPLESAASIPARRRSRVANVICWWTSYSDARTLLVLILDKYGALR